MFLLLRCNRRHRCHLNLLLLAARAHPVFTSCLGMHPASPHSPPAHSPPPPPMWQLWAQECLRVCVRVALFCILKTSWGVFFWTVIFVVLVHLTFFGPEIIIRVYSLSSRIINHFCMFSRVWRGLLFSHFFL